MYKKILLPIVLSILCVSCTEFFDTDTTLQKNIESTPPTPSTLSNATASIYLDEDAALQSPLQSSQVKFFLVPSKHRCVRLGIIFSSGNGYASFDDCINAAKKEAANVGADFIVLEGVGDSEEKFYQTTITKPWANFTAWYYLN